MCEITGLIFCTFLPSFPTPFLPVPLSTSQKNPPTEVSQNLLGCKDCNERKSDFFKKAFKYPNSHKNSKDKTVLNSRMSLRFLFTERMNWSPGITSTVIDREPGVGGGIAELFSQILFSSNYFLSFRMTTSWALMNFIVNMEQTWVG